jgi:lipopolysaccharide transport system permease protein
MAHASDVPQGYASESVIEAEQGWRWGDLREVWAYRELLIAFMQRDLRVRYKEAVLGVAWAVIQPVSSMLLFSAVFGVLAKVPSDGLPYPLFVLSALLPWTLFSGAVTTACTSLQSSQPLISKIYFPRLIIPLSAIGVALVDFAISAAVLALLMVYYGVPLGIRLAFLPVLVAILVLTALGFGTLASALTVAYRDFRHALTFLIQLWMFATPILYPASLIPEPWQSILYLNPMAGVIEGFRATLFDRPFDVQGLSVSTASGALILVIGVLYFARVERRFADII